MTTIAASPVALCALAGILALAALVAGNATARSLMRSRATAIRSRPPRALARAILAKNQDRDDPVFVPCFRPDVGGAMYSARQAAWHSWAPARYEMFAPLWVCAEPTFFFAISIAILVVDRNMRSQLGAEYGTVAQYETGLGDRPSGANYIMALVVAIAALGILLTLSCHAYFGDDGVRLRDFFSLHERTYNYGALASIRTAPSFIAMSGKRVPRRVYSFRFADGSRWTTNNGFFDSGADRKRELAAFVSLRSSRPIEELPVLNQSDM